MRGRRTAAMLWVLLVHALFLRSLQTEFRFQIEDLRTAASVPDVPPLMLIHIPDEEPAEESEPVAPPLAAQSPPQMPAPAAEDPAAEPSAAPTAITPDARVDWPIEARKSATRVLEKEREAERIARMFAGPDGTWASLTKRQRSELNKFRWRPGVEGLKYDDKGNAIYTLPNGCTIVNFAFFGCPIGAKEKVHGDMFDNMRLYFDEQRLPETQEGNGTEPEALRPRR